MSWSAHQYIAFEDEPTRPVRDLLNAVPGNNAQAVVDLGCGPGNSTEVLATRFPGAVVTGFDSHHPLAGGADAVVEWFKGSGLRPYLAPLDASEQAAYLGRYRAAVADAYPALPDGTVLLPFPRMFIVATR